MGKELLRALLHMKLFDGLKKYLKQKIPDQRQVAAVFFCLGMKAAVFGLTKTHAVSCGCEMAATSRNRLTEPVDLDSDKVSTDSHNV